MLKIFLLNFALWVVAWLQTCPTNFDISNKNGLLIPLNFCLWVVAWGQTRHTNFDISNKNSPCERFSS